MGSLHVDATNDAVDAIARAGAYLAARPVELQRDLECHDPAGGLGRTGAVLAARGGR